MNEPDLNYTAMIIEELCVFDAGIQSQRVLRSIVAKNEKKMFFVPVIYF